MDNFNNFDFKVGDTVRLAGGGGHGYRINAIGKKYFLTDTPDFVQLDDELCLPRSFDWELVPPYKAKAGDLVTLHQRRGSGVVWWDGRKAVVIDVKSSYVYDQPLAPYDAVVCVINEEGKRNCQDLHVYADQIKPAS